MLERLYVNENLTNKLKYQYRMHPFILKMPNELMYNDMMIDRTDLAQLRHFNFINDEYPIGFINYDQGKEEYDGFSIYNLREAKEVIKLVDLIYQRINPDDIDSLAILSPYRSQINCISNLLTNEQKNRGYKQCINTIDSYQGKENDLIIISMVRSNNKQDLGFLNNINRMNVMMTRAKSALIIIGDRNCLITNLFW